MALLHEDLINAARRSVFWSELPLLNRADDVKVVTLLVRQSNCGKLSVEGKIEPIRVFICGILCPILVRLTQSAIRERGP